MFWGLPAEYSQDGSWWTLVLSRNSPIGQEEGLCIDYSRRCPLLDIHRMSNFH